MTHRQFRLPDLGEGLTEAEIVRWLVEVGETVTVNQPLVEVETAKAVVEIPSPFAGVLVEQHGEAGTELAVGTPLLTIDEPGDEPATGPTTGSVTGATEATGQETMPGDATRNGAASLPVSRTGEAADVPGGPGTADLSPMAAGRTPMLVGYGPRSDSGPRRRRRPRNPDGPLPGSTTPAATIAAPAPAPGTAPTASSAPGAMAPVVSSVPASAPAVSPASAAAGAPDRSAVVPIGAAPRHGRVAAKPPVRKLARDLGVDLSTLAGTGPAGTISRADVETAARQATPPEPAPVPTTATPTTRTGPVHAPGVVVPGVVPSSNGIDGPRQPELNGHAETMRRVPGAIPPDAGFNDTDRIWRIPVTGVRRTMARAMVASVFSAPHATEFLSVDVTETMAARERIAALPDFAGIRVTPLLLVAKALLTAVRRHPMINSTWVGDTSGENAEIQVHERINLGIAVAGPRGLVVPNIPDAGSRGLVDLARSLHSLTEAARADRLRPADLSGGTITITNVGVLGVDTGAPVLNPGEAAILALGAIRPAPWVHEGELAVRTVAHLALSFDHRVVDGELGSAVLADVAAVLADPVIALAWS
ncbi:dihydrolipoamide acetyltransferase family protein [Parafrankia sp. FMc6]|uniref:dihydrolipoamide acetyltransferase family protein n=1 Tax=Parafrankia soli TaxID=2599596 RepID=UPI0034D68962